MIQTHYSVDFNSWTIYLDMDSDYNVKDINKILSLTLESEREHNDLKMANWKIRPISEMNNEIEVYYGGLEEDSAAGVIE